LSSELELVRVGDVLDVCWLPRSSFIVLRSFRLPPYRANIRSSVHLPGRIQISGCGVREAATRTANPFCEYVNVGRTAHVSRRPKCVVGDGGNIFAGRPFRPGATAGYPAVKRPSSAHGVPMIADRCDTPRFKGAPQRSRHVQTGWDASVARGRRRGGASVSEPGHTRQLNTSATRSHDLRLTRWLPPRAFPTSTKR